MKVKVSELSGEQLDWAVAKAEGWEVEFGDEAFKEGLFFPSSYFQDGKPCSPSTDWAHGGPILERERIDVMWGGDRWCAYTMTPDKELQLQTEGATPLIAAMRGYVASKLGYEVEVPEMEEITK